MRRPSLRLIVPLVPLIAAGCGPSSWESTFTPAEPAISLPPTGAEAVRLREVSWDRLSTALDELEAQRAASDAPFDEWPGADQDAAKARLLRALQVTADPGTVQIIGRSVFRTTSRTDPNDGGLEAFARTVGANTVVWSSNYLGKTQVVRDEPVTEWRTGSAYSSHGRRRSDTFTENSTIWVPVVVEADEHAFMAYYLREAR